jgi:hypothetical protein
MHRFILATALALAVTLPAHAQNGSLTRSFVSSAGSDSNPCTVTQPCATFARAYTVVGNNGIIAALDPGKYGPLTNIISSVTVNGNGWAAITGPAGGNAIYITDGNVTLIGLEIDGAGASYNGIHYFSGGNLTITNCAIQNFVSDSNNDPTTGNGILIEALASASFVIANTIVSQNGNVGLYARPFASHTSLVNIDHVTATANAIGIAVDSSVSDGGTTYASISNSNAGNNSTGGIYLAVGNSYSIENSTTAENGYGITIAGTASSGLPFVSIDNTAITNNTGTGIVATNDPNIVLGRSAITGNGNYGVDNQTTHSPTQFYTYGNNQINLNSGGNVNGTALKPLAVQ